MSWETTRVFAPFTVGPITQRIRLETRQTSTQAESCATTVVAQVFRRDRLGALSGPSQLSDQLHHVLRQRRLERQRASRRRMIHRQARRMQRLARKVDRAQLRRPEDVPPFTHERVAAQPRLYADLIALACHQADFYQ